MVKGAGFDATKAMVPIGQIDNITWPASLPKPPEDVAPRDVNRPGIVMGNVTTHFVNKAYKDIKSRQSTPSQRIAAFKNFRNFFVWVKGDETFAEFGNQAQLERYNKKQSISTLVQYRGDDTVSAVFGWYVRVEKQLAGLARVTLATSKPDVDLR